MRLPQTTLHLLLFALVIPNIAVQCLAHNQINCTQSWELYDKGNDATLSKGTRLRHFDQSLETGFDMKSNIGCDFLYQVHHNLARLLEDDCTGTGCLSLYHYNRALELKPDSLPTLSVLAVVEIEMGNWDRGQQVFNKLMQFIQTSKVIDDGYVAGIQIRSVTHLPQVPWTWQQNQDIRSKLLHNSMLLLKEFEKQDFANQCTAPQGTLTSWSAGFNWHYATLDSVHNLEMMQRIAQLYRLACPTLGQELVFAPNQKPATRKIRLGLLGGYMHATHSLHRHFVTIAQHLNRNRFDITWIHIVSNPTVASSSEMAHWYTTTSANGHKDQAVWLLEDGSQLSTLRKEIAELQLNVLLFTEVGMMPILYMLAQSRLAPVQISTWCFPATSGMPDTIDYYISSEYMEFPTMELVHNETNYTYNNFLSSPFGRDYRLSNDNEASQQHMQRSWSSSDDTEASQQHTQRSWRFDHYTNHMTRFVEQVVMFDHTPWLIEPLWLPSDKYDCYIRNPTRVDQHACENQVQERMRNRFGTNEESTVFLCTQSSMKWSPAYEHSVLSIVLMNPSSRVIVVENGHYFGRIRNRMLSNLELYTTYLFPNDSDTSTIATIANDAIKRITFIPRQTGSDGEYAGLYIASDVVLDTFPYGGFTTTIDAISMGTPVLTLVGNDGRSRFTYDTYKRISSGCKLEPPIPNWFQELVAFSDDQLIRLANFWVSSHGRALAPQIGWFLRQCLVESHKDTSNQNGIIEEWEQFLSRV